MINESETWRFPILDPATNDNQYSIWKNPLLWDNGNLPVFGNLQQIRRNQSHVGAKIPYKQYVVLVVVIRITRNKLFLRNLLE